MADEAPLMALTGGPAVYLQAAAPPSTDSDAEAVDTGTRQTCEVYDTQTDTQTELID